MSYPHLTAEELERLAFAGDAKALQELVTRSAADDRDAQAMLRSLNKRRGEDNG